MAPLRNPRPWLAAVFSLLVSPGVGHLYVGAMRTALIAFGIVVAIRIFLVFGGLFSFTGLIVAMALGVCGAIALSVDAAIRARRSTELPIRWFNRWYSCLLLPMLISLVLELVLPAPRMKAYQIPASSMEPTLLVGDYLFTDRWAYKSHPVQRGDVVVFRAPLNDILFIKRCIAVAGDTIGIRRQALFLNGEGQEEPYVKEVASRMGADDPRAYFGPVVVPEGHIFVMGDNRDNSHDSRYWGPLPTDRVEGKALFIYSSIDKTRRWRVRRERLGRDVRAAPPLRSPSGASDREKL